MATFLMEAVILSFTLGGIVGAIGALQLRHTPVSPVKAHQELERNAGG